MEQILQVNIFVAREIGEAEFHQFNSKSNLKLSRYQCEKKQTELPFYFDGKP